MLPTAFIAPLGLPPTRGTAPGTRQYLRRPLGVRVAAPPRRCVLVCMADDAGETQKPSESDPVSVDAPPAAEAAEAGKSVAEAAELVPEASEPVAVVAEAAEPVAEVVEAAEPVAQTEPEAEAAEPELQAAASEAEAPQPVVETAEPIVEAGEPVAETAEPEPQAAAQGENSPAESEQPASGADTPQPARDGLDRRRRRRSRPKREVTLPLEKLEAGMELEGTVKSVMDYGAFVGDFGTPTDGLLHVSQLGTGYVKDVKDVVNEGDKVKVRVLSIDLEKRTFSLTMKTAEELAAPRPDRREEAKKAAAARREASKKKWETFSFDPQQFVDVKVISVTDFGAFCQMVDGEGQPLESAPTDGLIHVSALSNERVESVASVLSVGQQIQARIIAADPKKNRISMSLKPFKSEDASKNDNGESSSIAEDLRESQLSQPEFKTTLEIAFERARAGTTATGE